MNTLVLHFLWQTNSDMSIPPSVQTSTFNHQNQPPELATKDGTRTSSRKYPGQPRMHRNHQGIPRWGVSQVQYVPRLPLAHRRDRA